jgi:hypothetical protein
MWWILLLLPALVVASFQQPFSASKVNVTLYVMSRCPDAVSSRFCVELMPAHLRGYFSRRPGCREGQGGVEYGLYRNVRTHLTKLISDGTHPVHSGTLASTARSNALEMRMSFVFTNTFLSLTFTPIWNA